MSCWVITYIYSFLYLFIYRFIIVFIYLYIYLSISLFIPVFTYLFIHLFKNLFISIFIHAFLYLFILKSFWVLHRRDRWTAVSRQERMAIWLNTKKWLKLPVSNCLITVSLYIYFSGLSLFLSFFLSQGLKCAYSSYASPLHNNMCVNVACLLYLSVIYWLKSQFDKCLCCLMKSKSHKSTGE